jgi:hypothetical protein
MAINAENRTIFVGGGISTDGTNTIEVAYDRLDRVTYTKQEDGTFVNTNGDTYTQTPIPDGQGANINMITTNGVDVVSAIRLTITYPTENTGNGFDVLSTSNYTFSGGVISSVSRVDPTNWDPSYGTASCAFDLLIDLPENTGVPLGLTYSLTFSLGNRTNDVYTLSPIDSILLTMHKLDVPSTPYAATLFIDSNDDRCYSTPCGTIGGGYVYSERAVASDNTYTVDDTEDYFGFGAVNVLVTTVDGYVSSAVPE